MPKAVRNALTCYSICKILHHIDHQPNRSEVARDSLALGLKKNHGNHTISGRTLLIHIGKIDKHFE